MSNYVYFAPTGDGWRNLAADSYFLDNVKKGDIILYFYVNTNAVIIGRNQNAWTECNLDNLKADSVQLVRRHTGGGAVYHDCGNLNFSFIMNASDYSQDRQFKVILNAMNAIGIDANLSGRNDILTGGKKFSGNAFGLSKGNRAHHGTILINSDLNKLPRYLNVSQAKIKSKGISSVRSRVCNLCDYIPNVNVEMVYKAILESFIREYGIIAEYQFTGQELDEVEKRYLVQKSWEWTMGKAPKFDYTINNRFGFGEIQLNLNLRDGIIKGSKLYSDCLDTEFCDKVSARLIGVKFTVSDVASALRSVDGAEAMELADYFEAHGL